MKTVLRSLAFVAAILMLPPAAHAAGPGDLREACREDARSFCQGIQPGGGRIMECLKDHYKEISDACYTALQNAPPPPQGESGDEGPPPDGNQ